MKLNVNGCLAALLVVLLVPAAAAATPTQPPGGLATAVVDDTALFTPGGATVAARVRAAGATAMRFTLPWSTVAPASPAPGSDPKDPGNPAYTWGIFDWAIQTLVQAGLEPIVSISSAPRWAQGAGAEAEN
jgi:hypothetical protein